MSDVKHPVLPYRVWYPYSGKRRFLNESQKIIHASGESTYMNTILSKLERIKSLSVEMKMRLDSISEDIRMTEKYLKESCPISYSFKIDDGSMIVWDSDRILIVAGRKGSTPLIEHKWPLRVKYHKYMGLLLDKIMGELERIVIDKEDSCQEYQSASEVEEREAA
jgi:hypothetical protein